MPMKLILAAHYDINILRVFFVFQRPHKTSNASKKCRNHQMTLKVDGTVRSVDPPRDKCVQQSWHLLSFSE